MPKSSRCPAGCLVYGQASGFIPQTLALPASEAGVAATWEGRGRSDCSGMPGSRKWPAPGPRRPRESGWWCGSWPATTREPRSIRHTQPLTDPRTICRGRLGRYVHAPPAVQWVQTQRRTRVGNCARVNKSEFPLVHLIHNR